MMNTKHKSLLTMLLFLVAVCCLWADPEIEVTWSEEIGYPDVIDWTWAYEDIFVGEPYPIPVMVRNVGDENLVVEEITCEIPFFRADPDNFILEPDEQRSVDFIFESDEAGEFEAEMHIVWNSPDGEDFVITVFGHAFEPPNHEWPIAIEEELFVGQVSEHVFNISNDRDEALRFVIEHEIISEPERALGPHRDDAGDVIFEFNLTRTWMGGFDWDADNDVMWVACYDPAYIQAFSYDGEEEVERIFDRNLNEHSIGIGYMDGIIYTNWWPRRIIYRYNTEGENIGNIQTVIYNIMDFAHSDENCWLLVLDGNRNIYVLSVEDDYRRVGLIHGELLREQVEDRWFCSICWVDVHSDGQLWLGTQGRAWQFSVDDEWNPELVGSFDTQADNQWCAIGHDGVNIWRPVSPGSRMVNVYDDGNREFTWLSYEPIEGEIEPFGDIDIIITLSAVGCVDGLYEAEIHILSNNPDDPDWVIPVEMHVTGAPDIFIYWDQEDWPALIDWNLAYDEIYNGGHYDFVVTVSNEGTDELEVADIFSDHDYFAADPNEFSLGIGEEREVTFTFNADEAGEFGAVMTIVSNDPDEREFRIELHAEALEAPVLAVDPEDGFDEFINQNEEVEFILNLANEGNNELRYEIYHEIEEQPEPDGDGGGIDEVPSPSPRRDDLGDVLTELHLEHIWATGFDWDPDHEIMWTAHYDPPFITGYRYDSAEIEEVVFDRSLNPRTIGIGYNDGIIYTNNWGEMFINRYDRDGNSLRDKRVGYHPTDFAHSRENNWLIVLGDDCIIHFLDIDNDYEEIGRIEGIRDLIEDRLFQSICWVDDHRNGQLWVGAINYVGQLCVDEEFNAELVHGFNFRSDHIFNAIGHDGVNVWRVVNAGENTVLIFDDGVDEIHWIDIEPREGTIEPGADIDVFLTINLPRGGYYEAELVINSNDPAQSELIVPVIMQAEGYPAAITWSEEFGYPDELDFDEAHQDIHVGASYPVPVLIYSGDINDLTIEAIESNHEYFRAEPDQLIVNRDEDVEILIVFEPLEPSEFEGVITFTTDDPDEEVFEIQVHGSVEGALELAHFDDFVVTENRHHLRVDRLTLNDEAILTGWEVGVFTPEGILAGGGVWISRARLEMDAYGDDPDTDVIDGFQADELMRFLVWDPETEEERNTRLTVDSGTRHWELNSESTLTLEIDSELFSFFLREGWNLMSINITPDRERYRYRGEGPDFGEMLWPYVDDITLAKDEDGRFYVPAFGPFCNIPFWNLTEGYHFKMHRDVEMSWYGEPIPADTDIPIEEGWNYIAYYPDYPLDASAPDFYVLSPIIEHVLIAKDGDGRFMAPEFNFSGMLPWQIGQGYQVKVDEDVVLNYPEEEEIVNRQSSIIDHQSSIINHQLSIDNGQWATPTLTGENMSVLVTAVTGIETAEGDQIAAFSLDNRLVGVGTIDADGRCGLSVWGDDPSTEEVDGLRSGDEFTLKMWNAQRNVNCQLVWAVWANNYSPIPFDNRLIYNTDDFTALEAAVIAAVPEECFLSEAYPNPFNSIARLTYGLPETVYISIRVYDTKGRLIETLIDGEDRAGYHTVIWDGRFVASGIYFIRMESSEFKAVRKVTLLK